MKSNVKNQIVQAQQKQKIKELKVIKWWCKNNYKVVRVILFPVWIWCVIWERYKAKKYDELEFTEEYCKHCIDKMIPKLIVRYSETPECFTIADCDDFGYTTMNDLTGIFSVYLEGHGCKKEIKFTRKFCQETKHYILNEYQIDGFKKMVLTNYREWKNAKENFGWINLPCSCDYVKCVVFYTNDVAKKD